MPLLDSLQAQQEQAAKLAELEAEIEMYGNAAPNLPLPGPGPYAGMTPEELHATVDEAQAQLEALNLATEEATEATEDALESVATTATEDLEEQIRASLADNHHVDPAALQGELDNVHIPDGVIPHLVTDRGEQAMEELSNHFGELKDAELSILNLAGHATTGPPASVASVEMATGVAPTVPEQAHADSDAIVEGEEAHVEADIHFPELAGHAEELAGEVVDQTEVVEGAKATLDQSQAELHDAEQEQYAAEEALEEAL